MKVEVLNWKGEKAGITDLPDKIFKVKPKMQIVHEAYLRARKIYSAPYGHVKGRSEVRGGGAKPWRQKGTGRARHGSNRSPLWVGGGVAHGPNRSRSFVSRFPKKQLKLALAMVLSDKLAKKEIKIVTEAPEFKKTKEFFAVLAKLSVKKTLLVTDEKQKMMPARNIPEVRIVNPKNLGMPQLLWADTVLIEEGALAALSDRL
jgi:large subunit ribosomal protein L4